VPTSTCSQCDDEILGLDDALLIGAPLRLLRRLKPAARVAREDQRLQLQREKSYQEGETGTHTPSSRKRLMFHMVKSDVGELGTMMIGCCWPARGEASQRGDRQRASAETDVTQGS
jgi:hypothetical protein